MLPPASWQYYPPHPGYAAYAPNMPAYAAYAPNMPPAFYPAPAHAYPYAALHAPEADARFNVFGGAAGQQGPPPPHGNHNAGAGAAFRARTPEAQQEADAQPDDNGGEIRNLFDILKEIRG
jgi:hypothetical protein